MSPDDWRKVNSYVALEKPEYVFELDEYRNSNSDQLMFVHLWVRDWSLSVFKSILHEWELFRGLVDCPLYALGEEDDDKWRRFVTKLGFQQLAEVVCENGEPRRLFVSFKTNTDYKNNAVNLENRITNDGARV